MIAPSAHRRCIIAYLDCFSGISGDMFLGAMIDAGLPLEALTDTLRYLDLDDYRLEARCMDRHSVIHGTQVKVSTVNHPPERDWQSIQELIQASRLPSPVKTRALDIFTVLAEAEAKVHGCPVEAVHFHEVGAVDSIVDIVGTAIGLDYLGVSALTCSPLPLAKGWIKSAHGVLPLPAPAVCELLKGVPAYGVEFSRAQSSPDSSWGMELVTPTGAAIVKACASGFGVLPAMTITHVGYGAGSKVRPDGRPNLLRLILGESRAVCEAQQVIVTESNLDDWSPETFPHLCDRLFAHGALDVTLIPIQMKKGRPGFTIQIISPPDLAFILQQLLLTETTAIGLRYRQEERRTLPRSLGAVPTPFGLVRAKLIEAPSGLRMTPEYEDCRRLANQTGTPIIEIYRAVASQPPELFQQDSPEEGITHHVP